MSNNERWQDAPKNDAHKQVFDYVGRVESAQSDIYERFLRYAYLYDPHSGCGFGGASWASDPWNRFQALDSQVTENVCAANVDTVTALIGQQKTRVRFMTDGGDWSTQRRARHLELYVEGLMKKARVHEIAQAAFKDSAIFGTGLVKVYPDGDDVCVERILVDEIVVDEGECKTSAPRQMHQRKLVDRRLLMAAFPGHEDDIRKANTEATGWSSDQWANYRPIERDQCIVIESFQLPYGDKPGRHLICVDGATLLDEEWNKYCFPYARIVWSEPPTGYYGIGLISRIAGHQRALNKLNWQIDRQMDQIAVPTTWVRQGDARIAVEHTNRLGTFGVYRDEIPKTVIPPSVSAEQFKRISDVKSSAFEESGVSRLAASSLKPAGLESAVALREYKDNTTERFAIQEQAYERFVLDIAWLMVDSCKELGGDAPDVVSRRSRNRIYPVKWSEVDMGETRVQMEAASTLSRTPAGRTQTVIEWAQAGVVTQDEARRLLQHPDLERAMSLYTAALEDIERTIEDILDGEQAVPEPYQNLKMGVWRMQQAYLKAIADGAPEETLEALRTWTVQAAWILNPPAPPLDPMGGMGVPPGQPAMDAAAGGAPVPGSVYPVMGPPPSEALGPALSPQAMQIAPSG